MGSADVEEDDAFNSNTLVWVDSVAEEGVVNELAADVLPAADVV